MGLPIIGASGGIGGQFASSRQEISIGNTAPLINVKLPVPSTLFIQVEQNWPQTVGGVPWIYPAIPLDLEATVTRRSGGFVYASTVQIPRVGLILPIIADDLTVQIDYVTTQGLANPWPSYIISAAICVGTFNERPVYRYYKTALNKADSYITYVPKFCREFRVFSSLNGQVWFARLGQVSLADSWMIRTGRATENWTVLPLDADRIVYYAGQKFYYNSTNILKDQVAVEYR